jgi:hypothetical protein
MPTGNRPKMIDTIPRVKALLPTGAFVLLGPVNRVFHRSVRYSAFYPILTFTIELQNKFSTLVLRSAAVAGGDE